MWHSVELTVHVSLAWGGGGRPVSERFLALPEHRESIYHQPTEIEGVCDKITGVTKILWRFLPQLQDQIRFFMGEKVLERSRPTQGPRLAGLVA